MFNIRLVEQADFQDWKILWQAYLDFYNEGVPEHITQTTWQRFFDEKSNVICHIAEHNNKIVGFTVSVVHPSTWSDQYCCYLEDLFVAPDVRGKGVGRHLIDNLKDLCRKNDWSKLYWHTNIDNAQARALYDKYKPADDFVRYTISVGS